MSLRMIFALGRLGASIIDEFQKCSPPAQKPLPHEPSAQGYDPSNNPPNSDSDVMLRLCFDCGANNRLPLKSNEALAKCGNCKSPLLQANISSNVVSEYIKGITCPHCKKANFTFIRQTDRDVDLRCNECKMPYFAKK